MFQQKGIAPPTNWDEFASAMQALKDPANGTYGIAFPFNDMFQQKGIAPPTVGSSIPNTARR